MTLQDMLATPVEEINPDRNPIAAGEHLIRLASVRTDMSDTDPEKVYRYACTFKVVDGEYAGRVFFDDIYPSTKAGGVNPVAARQIQHIIKGAYGNLEAVAGRLDTGEVLTEIAEADIPLPFTANVKNEEWKGRNRTRLAI